MPPTSAAAKERSYFDRLVEKTGATWWGSATPAGRQRLARRAELIAQRLRPLGNPLVLELGCGTGDLSQAVLDRFPELRLVACDVSPKAVQVAAQRCAGYGRARFQAGSALSLPYADNSFDALFGNSILHHVPLEASLRECRRILKPGAAAWFSEPNMMNPQIFIEKNVGFVGRLLQNTEDETAFVRWSLARRLRTAGFVEVTVEPFDFLHPLVPASLVGIGERVGRWLERVPLAREISGSLRITAVKPPAGDQ